MSGKAAWYLRVSGSLDAAIRDLIETDREIKNNYLSTNLVGKEVVAIRTSDYYDVDYGCVYRVTQQYTDSNGRVWLALDDDEGPLVPLSLVKKKRGRNAVR